MNFRVRALALACSCSFLVAGALAQTARQADFIVAVVNSEPITNNEVRAEVARVTRELARMNQAAPAPDELRRQVLERLINERAQLQMARETGIRVDDAAIDLAEQTIARQNQVDVAELRARMAKDGVDTVRFRSQLRDQILLSRLHEREIESRIRVSDTDVDHALEEQQANNTDPFAQEINLANLLVAVPEKASAEQVKERQQQAQQVLARIRAGEDFARLVQEVSAAERSKGGELGLRRADRYPPSFVLATQNLAVGQVSDIVRSGAGFHILKVIEKRAPAMLTKTVVQTHARHILLRTDAQLTQAAAIARLAEFKKRIQGGKASFQELARQYSQDGSAAQGGDLGWANPGMFVPEFEEPMNRLTDGQVSDPIVSRFGVHLIEMIERRRVDLNPREVRELVRNQLRATRAEEAYATWVRDVRARSFVELREPPQ